MSEIMIIGSSQVLTASGADGTENHLRFGAENDRVTLIQRTWPDIHDMFDDAARHRLRYAIKHFIVAPYEPTSRHFMLTVALPLLAKEFKFKAIECSVVEHEKDRADAEAFNIHWHVVCPHFIADGHVNDWWQDFQRQEKVARILEYKLWLLKPDRDPNGPRFVRGRFHAVNIAALLADKDPEMQAIGAELERVLPLGIEPEGTAPPAAVVRMHAREGRDILAIRKICREAWRASTDAAGFERLLKDAKLYVQLANQLPPRWMIRSLIDHTELGSLAGLAHAKRSEVIARMKDPKYDDFYNIGAAGGGGGGEAAVDDQADRGRIQQLPGRIQIVPPVEHEPERNHGACSPGLFVAALKRVDPTRLDALKARAVSLAESATAWAVRFFAAREKMARDYLAWMASDLPEVGEELAALRATSEQLAQKLRVAEEEFADRRATYNDLVEKNGPEAAQQDAALNYDIKATARQKLLDEIEEHQKKHKPAEEAYEIEAAQHRATKVAERHERAMRYLRVLARCRALIDKVPQVLWMGPEPIFARGLQGDKKAPPNARWLVDPPPPPPPAEDDTGYKPPGSTI